MQRSLKFLKDFVRVATVPEEGKVSYFPGEATCVRKLSLLLGIGLSLVLLYQLYKGLTNLFDSNEEAKEMFGVLRRFNLRFQFKSCYIQHRPCRRCLLYF